MDLRRLKLCAQLKIKTSLYFVSSMFSFFLNIISTNLLHVNETKQMDTDAFDFQEIKKSGAVFFMY